MRALKSCKALRQARTSLPEASASAPRAVDSSGRASAWQMVCLCTGFVGGVGVWVGLVDGLVGWGVFYITLHPIQQKQVEHYTNIHIQIWIDGSKPRHDVP